MTRRPPAPLAPLAPLALLALLATSVTTALAQAPPMPEQPTLREGFLAWDRGDYPAALRAYLEVLSGPDAAEYVGEVALLTGELYRVTEVAVDGSGVAIAPDGSMFHTVSGGRIPQWPPGKPAPGIVMVTTPSSLKPCSP